MAARTKSTSPGIPDGSVRSFAPKDIGTGAEEGLVHVLPVA
jgi:hypothetical protein